MWQILEHKSIQRNHKKLPKHVLKKYELWKDIVFRHGPDKLREFPGFRDEKLKGEHSGQRSSRLSIHYRVIYCVKRKIVTVQVLEINPHEYQEVKDDNK